MVLLGVDPGFQFAGFAVISKQGDKVIVLDYGHLKLSPTKHLTERTALFYDFFNEKIQKYNVTHLALETPFLGKNAQNFLKLGYLRGILYLLTHKYTLQLYEFAPREVKQAVTGYGGASKEQVSSMVFRLFPRIKQEIRYDVTDAFAVTLCGVWKSKINNLLQK